MKKLSYCWLGFLAISPVSAVHAQSMDPINTERPSFSSSPLVLSPGDWQIESGYQYTHDGNGTDVDLQVFPQALLRYGMNDEIELQFGWPGLARLKVGNNSESGMTEAVFGVKIQDTEDTASVPVAFLASVNLPIGDREFSSDKYDPTIGAAWSHSRFFGTATVSRFSGDYIFSNGVGASFALRNDTGAYAEWQASIPENGGSAHSLNGGLLWLRQNSMQWDLNASLGLNDRAPDFSIGGGFSYRF
jgi:hypothetical protein